jgi:hypothetical protein
MKQNETIKMPKKIKIFYCECCNFSSSKKSNYITHMTTPKHMNASRETAMKLSKLKNNSCICDICNIYFNSRTSLWRHKKKCQENGKQNGEHNNSSELIEIIKQNTDFKELILEQNKLIHEQSKSILELSSKNVNTTVNNCINNNQKFNLNFFLNTTCKDAMNMSDFIENLEIDLDDIENIGKNGYVNGMVDMIVARIKDLDITQRPLHCTDLKRETMYIKDNNEWSKDTDNEKLHNMINYVAERNYAIMPKWREKNPECLNLKNPKFDFCIVMMQNVLGDIGDGQIKLDNKVIKRLSKHIFLDKNAKN